MAFEAVGAGGDFRIGDVFSRAWSVFTGNLVIFVGITLVAYVTTFVVTALLFGVSYATTGQVSPEAFGATFFISSVIVFFVVICVNILSEATILFGAFQYLRGQPVRIGEALAAAVGRLLPLIGLSILAGLAVGIGMLLLIVPGVILFVMWAVIVPVCVVERLGPTASMSRSSALTKGHRWKILGILLLVAIINAVGTKLLGLALFPISVVVAQVATAITTAFVSAYAHCVIIMTYHDLRVAKEGVDTEQIASVFD
jgi:hypothetical protein